MIADCRRSRPTLPPGVVVERQMVDGDVGLDRRRRTGVGIRFLAGAAGQEVNPDTFSSLASAAALGASPTLSRSTSSAKVVVVPSA
jgi:hypothetical protein